jgi:predicted DsbA family dithiol-disulfide isomerase
MPAVLEVASDIHCPWAYVCVLRLRRARDALGLDVTLRHLYWPLELVNQRGAPRRILDAEMPVLAQLEPDEFAAWGAEDWPTTFLSAFELVKAAEEQGPRAPAIEDLAQRVLEEYEQVNQRGIEGSPEIYLPGGQRVHNPGLTKRWIHGIPHVLSEDRTVYEQLLRAVA